MKTYLSILLVILTCEMGVSQTYSLKISEINFNLDTAKYTGYTTAFVQPYDDVKKEWWKYIKTKAIIQNKITHYELKFPTTKDESNTPVYMVSELKEDRSKHMTHLNVALRSHGLNNDQLAVLNTQLKNMLMDFKATYLIAIVQGYVNEEEKKSIQISRDLDKLKTSRKNQTMNPEEMKKKEEAYRLELKEIAQKLDSLKDLFHEIK